jgi:hypothetical protein
MGAVEIIEITGYLVGWMRGTGMDIDSAYDAIREQGHFYDEDSVCSGRRDGIAYLKKKESARHEKI